MGPRYRTDALAPERHAWTTPQSLQNLRAVAYYQSTHAEATALDCNHRPVVQSLKESQAQIERTADAPTGTSWASQFGIGRWAYADDFLECAEGIQSVKVRVAAKDMRVRLAR